MNLKSNIWVNWTWFEFGAVGLSMASYLNISLKHYLFSSHGERSQSRSLWIMELLDRLVFNQNDIVWLYIVRWLQPAWSLFMWCNDATHNIYVALTIHLISSNKSEVSGGFWIQSIKCVQSRFTLLIQFRSHFPSQ